MASDVWCALCCGVVRGGMRYALPCYAVLLTCVLPCCDALMCCEVVRRAVLL